VILTVVQSLWAGESLEPMWLRSLHVLDAFFIVGLSQQLAQLAVWPFSKAP
jgi:hypothetical protein